MYARIVVALDGSELAERVLPYAEALAKKFGSTLTLVRTTTPAATLAAQMAPQPVPVAPPVVDPAAVSAAEQQEAADYLRRVAERLAARGLEVERETREGRPAEAIAARAEELEADLIAMTTHGRGGLGRALLGSVADAVVRHAPCPVLLVRIPDETPLA